MNAKLVILLISAALGAAGGVGISIAAGWGLLGGVLMYSAGGSTSLFAASLLILAAERPAGRAAHA
ncbi:MAG: hypothetical protein QM699_14355 [Amaricoccus sp.]|uniref:hypothetical protein n=1 Tax=Amaricoccus sp. TaxID=1872485 RepID=UPI0039E5D99C